MPKLPDASFEIPEAVLGAYVFTDAALKPEKPALSHICIEYTKPKGTKERTLHAVATDGYRLIHLSWIADPNNAIPEGIMLIPRHTAEEVLKTAHREHGKGNKTVITYWMRQGGDEWRIWTNIGTKSLIPDTPSEYPNWRQVIPKRPKSGMAKQIPIEFGANWEYMNDFRKYLKKYSDHGGVKIIMPVNKNLPILMIPVHVEYGHYSKAAKYAQKIEYYLGDGITKAECVLAPLMI